MDWTWIKYKQDWPGHDHGQDMDIDISTNKGMDTDKDMNNMNADMDTDTGNGHKKGHGKILRCNMLVTSSPPLHIVKRTVIAHNQFAIFDTDTKTQEIPDSIRNIHK
jgi:hypothetical protein